jgi:hypothetical protein
MVDVIKENNLIYVDSLALGDVYSWCDIEVYFSKEKNRYFWIEGAGCSCESLWEDVSSLSDMCDGNKESAMNAVRSFASEYSYMIYGDIVDTITSIKNFKE